MSSISVTSSFDPGKAETEHEVIPNQQMEGRESKSNTTFLRNPVTFPLKFVVAPMVNASQLPMRMLCRKYGADLCYTPMFYSHLFAKDPAYRAMHFQTTPQDRPLVVQFCGDDPDVLLQAATLVQDQCDAVDINLGCPQREARSMHYGAYLLDRKDRSLVIDLVQTLATNLKIPVFAKLRILDVEEEDDQNSGDSSIGIIANTTTTNTTTATTTTTTTATATATATATVHHNHHNRHNDDDTTSIVVDKSDSKAMKPFTSPTAEDKERRRKKRNTTRYEKTLELCLQLQEAGASLLTIHGRVRGSPTNRRKGPANLSIIKSIKAHPKVTIPIIANGNVKTFQDVQRNLDFTKCDGIMSAEGILHNPSLFSDRDTLKQKHTTADSASINVDHDCDNDDAQKMSAENKSGEKRKRGWSKHKKKRKKTREKIAQDQKEFEQNCNRSLRLALEYINLVKQYGGVIVSFVQKHIVKMCYDSQVLLRFQTKEELLDCETLEQVEAVIYKTFMRKDGGYKYQRRQSNSLHSEKKRRTTLSTIGYTGKYSKSEREKRQTRELEEMAAFYRNLIAQQQNKADSSSRNL